jgi:ABC-type phosphate transport system substrate-binding protein
MLTPSTQQPTGAKHAANRLWALSLVGALACMVFCSLYDGPSVAAEAGPQFVVIVQRQSPLSSVPRELLADLFLKKVTRWPDGSLARPLDLTPRSPVRARFSESVLKRSVETVRMYWQQRIFSGRDLPPPELETDEAVVGRVAATPGAVGYVSATTNVSTVKVVKVLSMH